MKLRIRGNSIRLRLTQGEVARIAKGERVEETLEFGLEPHQRFTYALEVSNDSPDIEAQYQHGRITVRLPEDEARAWAHDDSRVGMSGEQSLRHSDGNESVSLMLLVEKDFACLTERRGADDADTFPHPLEGTLRC